MEGPKLPRTARLICGAILFTTLVFASHPAFAEPEILRAEVNSVAQTVTVTGENFGRWPGRVALVGSRGSVFFELVVLSWNDSHVVAYLPNALASGSYRLAVVANGWGRNGGTDMIDLAIVSRPLGSTGGTGSAGPAGPQGPAGAQGPVGPAGPPGPTGAQGPAGAQGAPGAGFQAKGAWDPLTAYLSGDVVEHEGSSFVATDAASGEEPPSAPWQLMAKAGAAGAPGLEGPAGPEGAVGPVGPPGMPGPAGAPGAPGSGVTVGVNSLALGTLALSSAIYLTVPTVASVTVPAGATVNALVNAEGDLNLGGGPGNQALVELHLVIDGLVVRTLRVAPANLQFSGAPSSWHLGIIQPLPAGPHDIHVEAKTLFALGGTVTVNMVPGNLSVALLAQ